MNTRYIAIVPEDMYRICKRQISVKCMWKVNHKIVDMIHAPWRFAILHSSVDFRL